MNKHPASILSGDDIRKLAVEAITANYTDPEAIIELSEVKYLVSIGADGICSLLPLIDGCMTSQILAQGTAEDLVKYLYASQL